MSTGAAAGNRITVRVFGNRIGNNVVFTHDWQLNGGKAEDPPIELPPKSGPWPIDIDFYDFTGLGLELEATGANAIWIKQGKGCPAGQGNGGGQVTIGAPKSKSSGPLDQIEIIDANTGPACELHFMLRFQPAQGKSYAYDPVIKNGGGG